MFDNKPILITGSHRSGSTWVGKMLAQSPSVRIINEPFNLNRDRESSKCLCGVKFDYWFPYICQENEDYFYQHIKHTIDLSYNLKGQLNAANTPSAKGASIKGYGKFLMRRLLNIRPLIKDPIAVFSAEWLASKFNMDVVILIRHPASFAGSLKRLNWNFPFSDFLNQPLLMKDYLYTFEGEIKEYAENEKDIIDQAILLWRIIYSVIIKYQEGYHSWMFLRHEDISREPVIAFEKIFNQLNLGFSKNIIEGIKAHSHSANPTAATTEAHLLRLNSKANIESWKERLTASEIQRIRTKVEDVSSRFYSDRDW
ncbi:MAG: sulfotransferase [Aphanothece sp. CMT-3BRIN-NPC111]|nr:sulfotransferase [Aphanothece sp. CMT-3BRIN-NPC111]